MSAIKSAEALSSSQVKLNCVVMRDFNLNEITDFVALSKSMNIDVRFIEWMPFDSNQWNDSKFVSYGEMLDLIKSHFPTILKLNDGLHDTSKAFALPHAKGQFGFITSMSEHFCGGCNRLRLTADGNLKMCLFGNTEVSLRDAMRVGFSDDELRLLIQASVKKKEFALGGHGDMYGIAGAKNRPMILIGG
jgi:cyclic pyranopterin phosphate synthase